MCIELCPRDTPHILVGFMLANCSQRAIFADLMASESGNEERQILDLIGNALELQRKGVLSLDTLRLINDRIAAINAELRHQGVEVFIKGVEYEGGSLLGPTDMSPELDRTLDPVERMAYNYLCKVAGGGQVSMTQIRDALIRADGLFAKRSSPLLELIGALRTLVAVTKNSLCPRELVTVKQGENTSYYLLQKTSQKTG